MQIDRTARQHNSTGLGASALLWRALFSYILAVAMMADVHAGSDSPLDWLRMMNNASEDLSYQGTFVYIYDNQVEAMRVVRRVSGGSTRERLYSLNGSMREIVRDQQQVWCYLPEKKMGVHQYRQSTDNTFPRILPREIDDLTENYSIELGNRERIADREAQKVRVLAKDEYRYGYDLWVHTDTGLLLRADLLDNSGKPVEQYMFAQIDIDATISDDDLSPRTPRSDLVWVGDQSEDEPVPAGGMNWVVNEVPNGFMLSRHIRRLSPMRQQPVEHLVYSDGLAAVSIFVEKKMDRDQSEIRGLSKMGAVHAFGTMVGDYQITVVGEVPSGTVDLIGMSVTHK